MEEVVETIKPFLPGCVRDISIDDQLLDLQQNTLISCVTRRMPKTSECDFFYLSMRNLLLSNFNILL